MNMNGNSFTGKVKQIGSEELSLSHRQGHHFELLAALKHPIVNTTGDPALPWSIDSAPYRDR